MTTNVSTSLFQDRRQSETVPRPRKGTVECRVICTRCGQEVVSNVWQPRLTCPGCSTIGAPDRSMRYLLPLSWECGSCGEINQGQTNFCLHCGNGLTSRCRRCEWPVYGTICLNCGSHQAHLVDLNQRQNQRVEWISIQRQRIAEQRAAQSSLEQNARVAAVASNISKPSSNSSVNTGNFKRRKRRGPFASFWRMGWGTWLIIWGAFMLLQRGGQEISTFFTSPDTTANIQALGSAISRWYIEATMWLQGWWLDFIPTFAYLTALTPQDPQYGVLFASTLIGLATLPVAIFLLGRFVRRLIP